MKIQVEYNEPESNDGIVSIALVRPVNHATDFAELLYPILHNSAFDPEDVARILMEIAEGNK